MEPSFRDEETSGVNGGDETHRRVCEWVARDVARFLLNLLEMRQSQARNLEVSGKATDFSVLT